MKTDHTQERHSCAASSSSALCPLAEKWQPGNTLFHIKKEKNMNETLLFYRGRNKIYCFVMQMIM